MNRVKLVALLATAAAAAIAYVVNRPEPVPPPEGTWEPDNT